ncbi:MAG: MaoC family dehydratase [Steroidobacteraceae bacterium]
MAEGSGVKVIEAAGAAAAALQSLQAQVGQEVHVSDWLTVTQDRVNAFAAATDDQQWIHVDPVRAKAESPYGATIARLPDAVAADLAAYSLQEGKPFLPGAKNVVNYGLNKLRFPNAVRVGSRIRGRFTLVAVETVAPNVPQVTEATRSRSKARASPAASPRA